MTGAALREARRRLGALVEAEAPLGARTTYRVGGTAALLATPGDEGDLAALGRVVGECDLDVLVVGRGSNLLVADGGFEGLAILVGDAFASIEVESPLLRAGGGAFLPVVARRSAAAGLRGFEWAVGVPGSVGGAVRMNAGGHGSDIAACLLRARVADLRTGAVAWRAPSSLALAYRASSITPTDVVVAAEIACTPGDAAEAEALIAEIVRWRRDNQPGGQNAGSVFTNPEGDTAGRVIDAAGLKGLRLGSAEVSPKHANFIQADEGGSADDVLALIREIQRRVHDATGVQLRTEVRLVGFGDAYPRPMAGRHG